MARLAPVAVQQYRGTTAQHASYTGPAGELTVDTTKKAVVVQDGTTAGGITMAREDRTITAGTGLVIGASDTSHDLASDFTVGINFSDVVSAKTGNALELANGSGEDGKLYVAPQDVDNLIAANDELLWKDANGKIATGLELAYNTTTGKFDITNHAGTIIATVTVPSSVSMLQSAELVVDPVGQPAGTYLHFVFKLADGTTSDLYVDVTSLIDVYTAGAGIDLTSGKFSADLTANGGLKFSANGDAGTIEADFPNLISAKADNAIVVANGAGEDGKLYVPRGVVVSADAGNMISAGTDGGALLTCANAKSSATGNQIQCDSGKFLVVSDYGTMD